MKEIRYFYAPDVATTNELPADEAAHCLRVLRLQSGDEIYVIDGCGGLYKAVITTTTGKRCLFRIEEEMRMPKEWKGHLHLAVAPTKNNDRIEWFAEKATEIGFDELSFLNCRHSERRQIKTERIDKILVSAMKQSHKFSKPKLNEMMDFNKFVETVQSGQNFIAHCYDEADIYGEEKQEDSKGMMSGKPFLMDVLDADADALVLIGPEGDFSVDEVRCALSHGFHSVHLGRSRLRTETAALVAVHLMRIVHEDK